MPLRRPSAGRCLKAFTLPVSMLSLLILYSVRLITLASTSQLALEQYKTQLHVTPMFRGTSSMMLLLIFSHWWNMYWTWNQWCSAFKCWAVILTRGSWPCWWFGCGEERDSIARSDELQDSVNMSCQESWIIMGLCVLRFQPLCDCPWFTPWQISQHTMISLHMEAFAFSTAVPKIPLRGVPVASPRNTTIINLSPKKSQAWFWNQELGRKWVNCVYCRFLTSLAPWFCLC